MLALVMLRAWPEGKEYPFAWDSGALTTGRARCTRSLVSAPIPQMVIMVTNAQTPRPVDLADRATSTTTTVAAPQTTTGWVSSCTVTSSGTRRCSRAKAVAVPMTFWSKVRTASDCCRTAKLSRTTGTPNAAMASRARAARRPQARRTAADRVTAAPVRTGARRLQRIGCPLASGNWSVRGQ